MKTLQIDETNAKKWYKEAAPEFKAMLEDTFKKEFFSDKITDRVKTYEDACKENGESPMPEGSIMSIVVTGLTTDERNYRKLKTITKALNEGWAPDWSDSDQKKWFPYFDASSGFAFGGAGYRYSHPCAGDGSRLCFKSKELAEYAGRQFTDLYKGFIL